MTTKPKKKTEAQIDAMIKRLRAIRPRVVPRSYFGDDNIANLDALIKVLERRMDEDDVYKQGWTQDVESHAVEGALWMAGQSETEDLAGEDQWPMK